MGLFLAMFHKRAVMLLPVYFWGTICLWVMSRDENVIVYIFIFCLFLCLLQTRAPKCYTQVCYPVAHYQTFHFSTTAFFVLTSAKSRAKSHIAQKASVERGMFGGEPNIWWCIHFLTLVHTHMALSTHISISCILSNLFVLSHCSSNPKGLDPVPEKSRQGVTNRDKAWFKKYRYK